MSLRTLIPLLALTTLCSADCSIDSLLVPPAPTEHSETIDTETISKLATTGEPSIQYLPSPLLNHNIPLDQLVANYLSSLPKTEKIIFHSKRIKVYKSQRKMKIFIDDYLLKEYRVALGGDPVEDKVQQGDLRTPEGSFFVVSKFRGEKGTWTDYQIHFSYPNQEDAKRGLQQRLINKAEYHSLMNSSNHCHNYAIGTKLGGHILIHGGGIESDWTLGCLAVDDQDIPEIYQFVESGCSWHHGKHTPRTEIIICH